jgi:hypothetical protein
VLYLSGKKKREIARQLEIDRETVSRILSQEETKLLVHGYRDAMLRMVPDALIGAYELVKRLHPQTTANVLYGTRVLIDRHEVEKIEPPKRTFASAKVEYFYKHGKWPTQKQAEEFDKTVKYLPLVKGPKEVR